MRLLPLLLIVLLVAGCEPRDTPAPEQTAAPPGAPGPQATADPQTGEPRWETNLQGREGFTAVGGTAHATSTGGETEVTASVRGATAGATHPWHIHSGSCATGGPIVGGAAAYSPLRVGDGGEATATARIDTELQAGQQYHVNVHASPQDMGTIAACGDLARRS